MLSSEILMLKNRIILTGMEPVYRNIWMSMLDGENLYPFPRWLDHVGYVYNRCGGVWGAEPPPEEYIQVANKAYFIYEFTSMHASPSMCVIMTPPHNIMTPASLYFASL